MSWDRRPLRQRPGFTLIEIIIAMVSISMIVTTVVVAFAGTIQNSIDLREYSHESYRVQEVMENRISHTRQEGDPANPMTLSVFGKQVSGYLVRENFTGTAKHLDCFVIQETPQEINLPTVTKVESSGRTYGYIGQEAGPVSYEYTGSVADLSLWYTQWFVADEYIEQNNVQHDYSIPLQYTYESQSDMEEDIYPTYPNSFRGTRVVNNRITLSSDYLGRHLVYHVQPVGNYGVLGKGAQSSLFYVMGVPSINGLEHHLDFNFFPQVDQKNLLMLEPKAVTSLRDVYRESNLAIKFLPAPLVGEANITKHNLLLDEDRVVRNQKILRLKDAAVPLSMAAGNQTSGFINLYYQSNSQGVLFAQNPPRTNTVFDNWQLKLTAEGKVQLLLPGRKGSQRVAAEVVYESDALAPDTMHTIAFVVKNGTDYKLYVDGVSAQHKADANFRAETSALNKEFGGQGDVLYSEILVYGTAVDNARFQSIQEYMIKKNKYND